MSESIQHKLDRIRKPRVHITYDVHIGDAIQVKEIPYIIGILADLSGMPKKELPLIAKRNFINIDRDNINDVLKSSNARLTFNVDNKINPQNQTLNVELNFKTMTDFDPLSIVLQVPELNKVFDQKTKLMDLLAKMENNAVLRDIIKLLAEDVDFRNKFKDYLAQRKKLDNPDAPKDEVEEDEPAERIIRLKIREIENKIKSSNPSDINNSDQSSSMNFSASASDLTSNPLNNASSADNNAKADNKDNTTVDSATKNNNATNAPNNNNSDANGKNNSTKTEDIKPKDNNKPQPQNSSNPKVEK